jgi:hypothetical protein
MTVPFIDLARAMAPFADAARQAVQRVLAHRQFILGKEVEAFERAMGESLGGVRVVGLSSGTDALLAGLMALGVRAGDRVLTSPFSFFATAGTIARLGAKPVFVDVEPDHFGLDLAKAKRADLAGVKSTRSPPPLPASRSSRTRRRRSGRRTPRGVTAARSPRSARSRSFRRRTSARRATPAWP